MNLTAGKVMIVVLSLRMKVKRSRTLDRQLKCNRGIDSSLHDHEELHNARSFMRRYCDWRRFIPKGKKKKNVSLELRLKKVRHVNRRWQEYVFFFFAVALRPNAGHDLLILDVSKSHTTTHHSR